jgi:hypothetical protein
MNIENPSAQCLFQVVWSQSLPHGCNSSAEN